MKPMYRCLLIAIWMTSSLQAQEISKTKYGQSPIEWPVDFTQAQSVRTNSLSRLEQQIRDLEWQMQNSGRPNPPDEATCYQLKLQLAELYNQRPHSGSSLDDGADACPPVTIPAGMIPYTDYGTTNGAANNFNPIAPCGTTYAPDKIYRFVPSHSNNYLINTFGSSYDTQLYVNTGGACPGNTQIGCNDDMYGSQSEVNAFLNAGQEYFIIVDGFQGYSGNYVLNIRGACLLGQSSSFQQECAESLNDPMHAAWDCNGGCNNLWNGGFEQYQPVNYCQFMRGNVFTYTDQNNFPARDTDSYYFTLTEPCSVRINVVTSFSFDLWLANYDGCVPTGIFYLPNLPACTPLAPVSQCLPAGTYTINMAPNFFSGYTSQLPYLFMIEEFPCSGCKVDQGMLIAPFTGISLNTCGQSNDNSLRPSQDYTYCVIIPYASDWSFSLCNSPSEWNSYLYLTSACNSQIVAQSNDVCGPHASIACVSLLPGNYYLTIEGATASDCGAYTLDITECLGSCCYGDDPFNLQCSYGSLSACNSLSGEFTLGQACAPEVCGVRPQCEDSAQFSQLPHLPTEAWTAVASDVYPGYSLWEDYSVGGVISSLRFWGLFTSYLNGQACINQPANFQITFVDSANGPAVQTYNVTATGYQVPQNYGANFPVYQYDVDLPTNCTILSGRVSIQSTDGDPCVFAWVTSPQGNGSMVAVTPGGTFPLPLDLSLCLSRGCPSPDSVVIRSIAADTCQIWFHVPEPSYVRVYSSTNINATFPATYTVIAAGSLPSGNWSLTDTQSDPQRRYVLTAQCGPPPLGPAIAAEPRFRRE